MMMSACGKQAAPTVAEGGVAELSITVCTSNVTKVDGAASGDALNNLRLWIVDSDRKIVKFVKTDDWQTLSGTIEGASATFSGSRNKATISFDDIHRATYTIYAVANYTGLDAYDGESKTSIDSAFEDEVLSEMTGTQTPSYSDEAGMPLSVCETVQLLPGANRVSAALERVLASFSIKIKNQSDGHQIVFGDAGLSDFNISSTYLFRHQDDEMPADSKDLPMPPFSLPISIGSGVTATVYSTWLYGGMSDAGYKLRMAVGAFPEGQDISGLRAEGAVTILADGHEVKADGTEYMIRSCYESASGGYPCLYLNGTSLGISTLTDADIQTMSEAQLKPYLWTFSGEDEGYVRSVADGKYHLSNSGGRLVASDAHMTQYLFNTRAVKPDCMYFVAEDKSLYLSYDSGSYYVSTDGDGNIDVTTGNYGNEYFWKLLPLTDVKWTDASGNSVTADGRTFIARNLTSFDEYNVPQPLTALWRNQRLTTNITVTFMSQTGDFGYEVEDWKGEESSGSFN